MNRDGEDIITVEFFLNRPELGEIRWYSQAGEGLVVTAVRDAVRGLIAGACTHALVWRAMYVPPGTYGRADFDVVLGDDQFTVPYGCISPLQWHALAYRHYLEAYGAKREAMAALVLNSRHNANRNQHAIFADRTLSREEYLAARMICDPLCLFDCDVPVTACVAMVMTTGERARDLKRAPAYVAAASQQTTNRNIPIHYTLTDHIESGKPFADRLWADAERGPQEWRRRSFMTALPPPPGTGWNRRDSAGAGRRMPSPRTAASHLMANGR